MSQKARFPIPSELNPSERVCISINVPNNQGHLAAFWGNLWELAKPYSWGNDSAHSALTLGEVWKQVWFEAKDGVDCMSIQFRDVDCDIVEFSVDGGETWEVLANFSDCFVSRHPYAPSRNEITPTGNYPNLILTKYPGQTQPLLSSETFTVLPNGQIVSSSFVWSIGGAGLMTGVYGSEMGIALHPFFRQLVSGLKASIGGYSGMPEIDSMLEVLISSNTLKGVLIKAASGQTYNMLENRKADGSLYSGFDKTGQFFMSQVSAPPSGNPGNLATFVYNTETDEIWYYIGISGGVPTWKRLLNTDDGEPIIEVTYDDADPGASGSATIIDGVLDIQFPAQLDVAYGDADPGASGSATINAGTLEITFPSPSSEQSQLWTRNARTRPDAGKTDSTNITLFADGWVMCPWELEVGDIITISSVTGWLADQTLNMVEQGYTGVGTDYFTGDPSATASGDYLYAGEPIMSIVFEYNKTGTPVRGYIPVGDLLAGAELTDVEPTTAWGVFTTNRPDILTGHYLFGAVQFTVTLRASGTGEELIIYPLTSQQTRSFSAVSEIGTDYVITIDNTWSTAAGSNGASDAWGQYNLNKSFETYRSEGCTVGIEINLGSGWEWLVPSAENTFNTYEFPFSGNGEIWQVRWTDCYYPNNSGSIHIMKSEA